jgi:hypothetical protein
LVPLTASRLSRLRLRALPIGQGSASIEPLLKIALRELTNTVIVIELGEHATGSAIAFTPKELRLIAQGCERSELPWVISQVVVPWRGSVTYCEIGRHRHKIEFDELDLW